MKGASDTAALRALADDEWFDAPGNCGGCGIVADKCCGGCKGSHCLVCLDRHAPEEGS